MYVLSFRPLPLLTVIMLAAFATTSVTARAADQPAKKPTVVKLAGGKLSLSAPGQWTSRQPRVSIIDYEFAIPAAEGDKIDGRLTIMRASGGVDANIQRWFGQFTQPDAKKTTKEAAKVSKSTIAGQVVHQVDVSGTYNDQRGPFVPGVKRENYRMLAAIIEAAEKQGDRDVPLGTYFIKFYGPRKTVDANAKAFAEMINSLK